LAGGDQLAIEEKAVNRELGRRRVFVFSAAFLALALFGDAMTEADMFTHVLDEIAIVSLSIIVLILIAAWRKKVTLQDLKKQHNIIAMLFAIMLIFKLYAITVEIGDPEDFGDEIPILIGLILTLLNTVL
jgi:uncharacterized membrane protein YozB (DUF420 family)